MKNKRHEIIIEIIQKKDIFTQEELQKELRERGFDVTQATVSRDIRRLRLTKRQTAGGRSSYAVPMVQGNQEHDRLLRVLRDSVRGIDSARNILVIKTEAGMAMAAAAAIDSLSIIGIVGCIAGDDTIMAVFKTDEAAGEACERLKLDLDFET
ncbi:MAG: arginine repressor [Lachnospiraceae bacterium]|nr:arginine repressor [Sarcina sp.]MBQ6590502.1 arginine repressor [Lachnospiraceae bacterium]